MPRKREPPVMAHDLRERADWLTASLAALPKVPRREDFATPDDWLAANTRRRVAVRDLVGALVARPSAHPARVRDHNAGAFHVSMMGLSAQSTAGAESALRQWCHKAHEAAARMAGAADG